MPELPEVETIKIGLQNKIVGLKIKKIQVLNPKSFLGDPKFVEGKKVLKIRRFAKILNLDLAGEFTLLIHLKMSGQLVYDDGTRLIGGHPTQDMRDEMPNKSTRVVFEFKSGSKLYFNDQRKFGWIRIIEKDEAGSLKYELLNRLGPEPLEKEFTWKVLKQNLLRHKSQTVKVAIMDQTVISGIGNIYASEACFNAKLDPRTKVSNLTDPQFKKIHLGIIKSLQDGISFGGSSKAHFVNEEGKKGYFLDYAYVYGRQGLKCKVCGNIIEKIQLAGRGTYFCPHCQK